MKRLLTAVFLIPVTMVGCTTASGSHEKLPPAALFTDLGPRPPAQVSLFLEGMRPSKGCIRIASLMATGGMLTSHKTLEQTLQNEGAQVGADFVLVSEFRAMKIGSIDQDSEHPTLFGVACRTAKARLGFDRGLQSDNDWTISYVYPNSLAERIGLKTGDRLLSVNGIDVARDPNAYEREVHLKTHGDMVRLEYVTTEGQRLTKEVLLGGTP